MSSQCPVSDINKALFHLCFTLFLSIMFTRVLLLVFFSGFLPKSLQAAADDLVVAHAKNGKRYLAKKVSIDEDIGADYFLGKGRLK